MRLDPPAADTAGQRRPPQCSTAAHRALEDDTLGLLQHLAAQPARAVDALAVADALASSPRLGDDQAGAVGVVCGPGGSVRAVLAPAGFGKTAMVHAAAAALRAGGRPVVAVAPTVKAVAELDAAGLAATTIARLRLELTSTALAAGTVIVLDEISQTSTRDANTVLAAVASTEGAMVVMLGDPRQSQPVKAGGLAAEIARLAAEAHIPAAELAVNRRQHDPADRHALATLRAGRPSESQTIRAAEGWEHQHLTPTDARDALADAAVADIAAHGAERVAVLAVSHVDAEDLADRIRHRLRSADVIGGPILGGPGWATERAYQAGDRVLLTPGPAGTTTS